MRGAGRWVARSLGFVLLAGLLGSVGPARLGAALAAADARWLALAAPGFLLFTWVKALRWFGLLRLGGLEVPVGRALVVYQASSFLAFVTPGRVGDLAKAGYLRRDLGAPWAAGLASTLADRALDLCVLAATAALALQVAVPAGPLRTALGIGLVALAAAAPALAWPPAQRAALGALSRLPLAGSAVAALRSPADRLADELDRLWSPRLLPLVGVTALAFGCLFAGAYALARGLGLPIGPATTAYAVAVSSVVALLPLSVSGIGTRDAALVLLLAPHGVRADQALSFSLAYLTWSLLFSNGLGAWCWLRDPLARTAREAEA
jgi:uncharacterized membrane protein YbhN (UPF0104 family)